MEFSSPSESGLHPRIVSLTREMDWMRGLRAAVALTAPLILGDLLGIPNLGWASLGGFEAILADSGGPYRMRLRSLATLSIGGGAGVFLGSVVSGNLHWALPVTVLWCFLWSYLAVLGQPFTSAGVLVQLVYICGIGAPADWRTALNLGLLLLAGGVWAMVLSLFLWPLDPYRPARLALADCYTELASFLGAVAELSAQDRQHPSQWHHLAQHHQSRMRRVVERGWEAVAHVRAERLGKTAQTHHLVVLLETADMLIGRTVALAEHLEAQAATSGEQSGCLARGISGLDQIRAAELWMATMLTRRSETALTARAKRAEMQQLPQSLEGCMAQLDAPGRFLLDQVAQSALLLETSVESAAMLRLGPVSRRQPAGPAASVGHLGYVYERLGQLRRGWRLGMLSANLTRDSLTLRHALRVSIVCGFDVALIQLFNVDHGYWLLLTSLIVLQPYVSGTLRRGMERIGGTVAGGIVAALLAMTLHSQMATAVALFPCALLALALMPVSYAAFSLFLTPAFVLAWMPYAGDWQLALVRTGNTIVGAVLSVIAMLFLFPAYERDRTPRLLQTSLAADRRYLRELAAAWRSRSRSSRVLANARRATGLAHNETEESMERLLVESWPRRRSFAQFATTFVTYLRRTAQSITTLTALEEDWDWKQSPAVQDRLARVEQRLAWLEDQLETGASTQPWPETAASPLPAEEHPGERQLERLERQTGVLHRQLLSLREHGWFQKADS